MFSIKVNDIFDELIEENKRLLNELLFANKCLNVFIDFKTKLNVIFDDLRLKLNSNEIKLFEDLDNKYKEVLNEKQLNKQ